MYIHYSNAIETYNALEAGGSLKTMLMRWQLLHTTHHWCHLNIQINFLRCVRTIFFGPYISLCIKSTSWLVSLLALAGCENHVRRFSLSKTIQNKKKYVQIGAEQNIELKRFVLSKTNYFLQPGRYQLFSKRNYFAWSRKN